MREIYPFGKFYGETCKKIKTSAFAFVEAEVLGKGKVPVHTHENAHFLYVLDGQYQASVKDKKKTCPSASVIYYPAGTTHSDHFSSTGSRRFLTISLTSETTKRLNDAVTFLDYSTEIINAEIEYLGRKIRKELSVPDSLSPLILEAMANEMIVHSARCLENSDKAPAWLKIAYELLNDCSDEALTIAQIAAQVGVHPVHLARTFRRFFNCSPGEFLRKRRIEAASLLLLERKKSLVEIALITGFADQSEFTRSFKKYTGFTPSRYRQLHN